jgi:hypothetical protein
MNPRLSMPTTMSMPLPAKGCDRLSIASRKPDRILQKRGDVVEKNSRLREVGDVSNLAFQWSMYARADR